MSFSSFLIHCWEQVIISGWVMMFCWMRDWWMEYMWSGIGSDVGVSELVLMSIIWVEIYFFGNMGKAFNGKGILLKWLLWSIYKKWNFDREKFFGNLTWDSFVGDCKIFFTRNWTKEQTNEGWLMQSSKQVHYKQRDGLYNRKRMEEKEILFLS